jgi:predicted acylesterase/phospholipase RssA
VKGYRVPGRVSHDNALQTANRRLAFAGSSLGVCKKMLAVAAGALLVSACASVPTRDAVPEQLVRAVKVQGFEDVRMWGDAPREDFDVFIQKNLPRIKKKYAARKGKGGIIRSNILALSGGADDGAFGAGLLVGWGEIGKRPSFDVVTGISAGALIAPFAFLGSEYDEDLAGMFTTHVANEIYQANVLAGLFGGSALADSRPLYNLISTYVDETMMRRVAAEHEKGRLLVIGTTNIDAQRPVYWNMGRLAAHNSPEALTLFRKILLASASIPGVFPPVRIRVVANGRSFDELHVDGGTTRQLFFSPTAFSFRKLDKAVGVNVRRRLFIIRNGKINPEWERTKETSLALAQRSLETLIKNQSLGDLTRMYVHAQADGIDFNLVAIPPEFEAERERPFDHAYMTALYKTGRALGRGGIVWRKAPPQ